MAAPLDLDKVVDRRLAQARAAVAERWQQLEDGQRRQTARVLEAFRRARVGEEHFAGTTGYGYHDTGRAALEAVYAAALGAEAALVRPQIASGTHALSACLFALLRPGDELLCITGPPYDTLAQVIAGPRPTALRHQGVAFRVVPLGPAGMDMPAVLAALTPRTRVVLIQRSRGYQLRPSIPVQAIGEAAAAIGARRPDVVTFVDNCYGEFVEDREPTEVGCSLMAGSLIKNPGGGIARSGGYVAGRRDLVEMAAERITAPGLGTRVGPTFELLREGFLGLFLAPHVVGEALKGAVLAAELFGSLGVPVDPGPHDPRTDIVQAIELGSPAALQAFCAAIQRASPVNSHVLPEPGQLPGYTDPVIMAGGTFTQGSSIELSADAPLRPPYVVYLQGGMNVAHVEVALGEALRALVAQGFIDCDVKSQVY